MKHTPKSTFLRRGLTALALTAAALAGPMTTADATSSAGERVGSSWECPAAEITVIWYGGYSDDSRCQHIPDWLNHLYYTDPMLTTDQRDDYQERAVFVQLRLRDLGYHPGTIDGMYGPRTAAAVTRLQDWRGLYVDGKVGPQTWESLFGLGRA